MAVNDHGLEVLKKAAEEVTSGDHSDYYLKTDATTLHGVVSTLNSTTTPLSGGATYTGAAEELTKYSSIMVFVATDRSGTLYVDYSVDGVNWDHTEPYTFTPITAGIVNGVANQLMPEAKYYRLRYVNGATAQGAFRLQATLKRSGGAAEIHPVSTAMADTSDAMVVKSAIFGRTTAGGSSYLAVKVNPSGALTVAASQDGTWTVTSSENSASTATLSNINQSTGSQTLMASNASRKGFMLWNTATEDAYIAFAATAASTSFTIIVPRTSGYEYAPRSVYTGQVTCAWAGAGSGKMMVTEY